MRFHFMFILIAGLIVFAEVTLGHGTESHVEESQAVEQPPATSPVVTSSTDDQLTEVQQPLMNDHLEVVNEQDHATSEGRSLVGNSSTPPKPGPMLKIDKAIKDFTLNDFPTLHPMVVHVPVIMIPVAFLFAIISLFFKSRYYVVRGTCRGFCLGWRSRGLYCGVPNAPAYQRAVRGSGKGSATTRLFCLQYAQYNGNFGSDWRIRFA